MIELICGPMFSGKSTTLFSKIERSLFAGKKMKVDKNKCDHIYFLIRATPTCKVSEIIHKLKQVSTYDMWQKHYNYLSKVYWSGQHHLWTRGYFCTTIGEVSENTIKKYISNQG